MCSADCHVPEPGTLLSAQGGHRDTGQAWEKGRSETPSYPALGTRRAGLPHPPRSVPCCARPPTQPCGQVAHCCQLPGEQPQPQNRGGGQTHPRSPQRHPGDAPAPGMKEQPCPGPSAGAGCCQGHLRPLRGWLGPRTRGREDGHIPGSGEAHCCPGYAFLPCRGRAGGLSSHFCVCQASQDRPSLNIVTARVAIREQGEGGGAAHTAAPQRRERAGTARHRHPRLSSLRSRELRGDVTEHKTARPLDSK